MTTTTVQYPWLNTDFINGVGGFHGAGSGKQKIFTFPDKIDNVSSVDFSNMKANGSSVTIRNTTSRVNGTFTATVLDENGNAIGASTINVNKSSTVRMSNLSKITLPSNSSVKSITFFASTSNAHMSLNTDEDSVFELVYTRPYSISFSPFSSAASFSTNASGSSLRIVERISNASRKIADDDDVELSMSDTIVHGLTPGQEHLLVLQEFGTAWFDIAENSVTTNEIGIIEVHKGSTGISAEWEEDYPGAIYTLTATSPTGDVIFVKTTELTEILTGLAANTSYTITISSSQS